MGTLLSSKQKLRKIINSKKTVLLTYCICEIDTGTVGHENFCPYSENYKGKRKWEMYK